MRRAGRSTFRKLYWGTLLGIFVVLVFSAMAFTAVGGPSGPAGVTVLSALSCAFWAWLLLGRPLACLLVPLFVPTLSCPGCGQEVEAVGAWDCSCGFRTHRERHVLAGRCPSCGKVAGYVHCPCCGCIILLW
jgi:hypothetical protein